MENLSLQEINNRIVDCRLCPRLVEFRERVAREKKPAYREFDYWGRPVPSLGNADARLLVLGLAPAAHGANRTGRFFTGDRSGDFLFSALYQAGFCNQPTSRLREDGLELREAYICAAIHCVPPDNRPAPSELLNCRRYLLAELQALTRVRVVVPLGRIAWQAYLTARAELGWPLPVPRPRFRHGEATELDDRTTLLASYHPSPQNTQTGRLTESMFNELFQQARKLIG
jgi:uracil-DNA glycosylase